ncbi:MAG: inorganic diphosphatase [Gemmataceae bacterium]
MKPVNLARLPTWDTESGHLNVIIETPKGSRSKLTYDPERGLFELGKVLPRGMVFPFDFGFIPSTRGEDGDPLDVLVLLEEPLPVGCLVPAELVAVIEAEQKEDGKTERNDRLIAIPAVNGSAQSSREDGASDQLLRDIEQFFISYNLLAGKEFKPLGRFGPKRAGKLIKKAIKKKSRK